MVSTPYQYLVTTGVIVADTSQILAGTQQEYKDAFQKQDLVVTPDTGQGVLITAETLARDGVVENNAAVANQINPNIAGGIFLDAIMALTGMQRVAQTQSVVPNVALTGAPGTIIPAGVQASTAAGDIFASASSITLNSSGTGTVNFIAVEFGPVPCNTDSLTQIVSGVIGWETVNNPTAATVGVATQSDQGARALRQNTLAFQGVALPEAITSALYATAGVTSLTFLENYNSDVMGQLISITGGATLSGTIAGMTTLAGSGSGAAGAIVVGTDVINYATTTQTLPAINPWPIADFATTGNITLSGLGTQTGGDWASGLTNGDIILVQHQSTATQNGLYTAASGSWSRLATMATSSTLLASNQGISMLPNSVYACVEGGTDVAVAAALLENKSSGAAWNGGDSVTVIEPASGQPYIVQFDRPTDIGILIKITVSNAATQDVVQAILDYANGAINGLAGFVVGGDVSPWEIAGAVLSEIPTAYISNVQISLSTGSPSFTNNVIPIGENQIAMTENSFITVVVP
jgi:hypothetical protein